MSRMMGQRQVPYRLEIESINQCVVNLPERLVACRVLQADYQVPEDAHVSAHVADLIAGMLVVDPGRRMSIQQIMQHPWFRCVSLPLFSAPPPPLSADVADLIAGVLVVDPCRRMSIQQLRGCS